MSDAGNAGGSVGGGSVGGGSTGGSASASPATSAGNTQAPTSASSNPGSNPSESSNSQIANRESRTENPTHNQKPPAETVAERQERLLAETDLDAFTEVTINGKKERVKVRDLQKAYGLDKAAQQKMEAAALERKKYDAELKRIMNMDIDSFAKMRKIDLDQIAEERLASKYELSNMTPQEREAYENKQELNRIRTMELSSKRELAKRVKEITGEELTDQQLQNVSKEQIIQYIQAKNAEYTRDQQNLEKEFLEAWQEQKLPKHTRWGKLIANELYADQLRRQKAAERGEPLPGEPLQARDAAAKVKKQWFSESRELVSQMDAQAIQEWLGKEVMDKLRAHDVERVTTKASFTKETSPGSPPASEKPKKPMNEHEWREFMKRS